MPLTIRIPSELKSRLDHLAEQTKRSKSFYIRQLIEDGLDDLEDIYLASATAERIRSAKERVLSSAQVKKSLGQTRRSGKK